MLIVKFGSLGGDAQAMSFIPKKRKQWLNYGETSRSHAAVVNQFTGQEFHFPNVPIGEEKEIADYLMRFFSEHPLRSGGMMHPAAVGLLEELGFIFRKEDLNYDYDDE